MPSSTFPEHLPEVGDVIHIDTAFNIRRGKQLPRAGGTRVRHEVIYDMRRQVLPVVYVQQAGEALTLYQAVKFFSDNGTTWVGEEDREARFEALWKKQMAATNVPRIFLDQGGGSFYVFPWERSEYFRIARIVPV